MPRIVIPLTSRGIELTDRACWAILAAAMAASAALLLYLSRGTTFGADELVWVFQSPGLDLGGAFEPYNGSLIATNRILYWAILETVGADYLAFRLVWVASVLLSAGLLFEIVKRRVGALPALAPAILLLFFGSAGEYFTSAIGFIALFTVAAGLAALLALERDDTLGDVLCCALITISVATFSIGLGFLVGVAISVLPRADRASRAWIFLVPLALYAAWWLWALGEPGASEGYAKASNVLLIPSYVADSLAATLAALTGLNYDFVGGATQGSSIEWGYALAVVAVLALGMRLLRGNVPRAVWVSLGIVLTVWVAGALVAVDLRAPDSPRYMYLGAIGVVLVASAAATRVGFTRFSLAILFGVAAIGLMTNLAHVRERSASTRDEYSTRAQASFAMLELGRDEVEPAFVPPLVEFGLTQVPLDAGSYLRAADEYGSMAVSLDALAREPVAIREQADRTLADAYQLDLAPPEPGRASESCAAESGANKAELPTGALTIIARGPGSATVKVGRFAPPSIELGTLESGEPATLDVPKDAYPGPWLVSVDGDHSVTVCEAE